MPSQHVTAPALSPTDAVAGPRQVTRMVLSALECGSDALLEHLFDECGLLRWLTASPRTVEPAPRDGDPRPGRGGPYRAGCAPISWQPGGGGGGCS